jgi:hypothetical protein
MAANGKRAKYKTLLEVGISDEIKNALETASDLKETTPTQVAREAIKLFLVQQGFMRLKTQAPAE